MRDLQRKKKGSPKIKLIHYGQPNKLYMKRSGNLGIVMQGNGGGADPKQKGYARLQSIIVTSLVISTGKNPPYTQEVG